MNTATILPFRRLLIPVIIAALAVPMLYSCNHSNASNSGPAPAPSLPVLAVEARDVTTYQEYTASLQGSRDIEIRPQVNGTLENIYVDEGAYVHKGQPLFRINAGVYREQYNNASATLQSAKAALENARINVDKLTPLVSNKVVSGVQLESAQATYDMAKANVAQAQAQVSSASINVGYTTITAPADGYVGTIPYKTGSLVGTGSVQPLTVLSETQTMHVYFSFSENDFMRFKESYSGNTIDEKIKQLPEVELQLADNSIYPSKGKIEVVKGQFDASMGAIQLRASFPNGQGLLRSGNTGRIRIPHAAGKALIIPQEATYELQDKTFVFIVGKDNKVSGRPVSIAEKISGYYVLNGGLQSGEQIVYAGLGRLSEGAAINPQPVRMDSLLQARPL